MIKILKRKPRNDENIKKEQIASPPAEKKLALTREVTENLTALKEAMNNNFDIKTREFNIGGSNIRAGVIFIENLVDEDLILDNIVKPLMLQSAAVQALSGESLNFDFIKDSLTGGPSLQPTDSFDEIVGAVMVGDTFLTIEGYEQGMVISSKRYSGRSVSEPSMEPSVKGAKEGFVEILSDNISLIRRRIRDPNLIFEKHVLGRRSKTNIIICYVKGITNNEFITEVRNRIQSIDTDIVSTSSKIDSLISDNPNCIFPLIETTERVDTTVSNLIEGRIVVIIEGTPGVLLLPTTLASLMQSVDDYYEIWVLGSVIRLTRYLALFISALLPAIYIALVSFHPGLFPTTLALSINLTRAGVPFPSFAEALLMEITLEFLAEAGLRLPRVAGQTVSIVGGLVIGQAAIQAGIVSPIMVMTIALTAIASFTIPSYSLNLATRVLRVPFMILAASFGAFGISMGFIYLLGYLSSQQSFGVPFLASFSPYRIRDQKDAFIRAPFWTMGKRPEFLKPEDTQRQIIKKGTKS